MQTCVCTFVSDYVYMMYYTQGTDSVSLHVSKLTVGVYHFKLTVTDSVGQIDYSEVTVDVLPGRVVCCDCG